MATEIKTPEQQPAQAVKTCRACGRESRGHYCDRCHMLLGDFPTNRPADCMKALLHCGLDAIIAIVGNKNNLLSAVNSVGGLTELQDMLAELARKSDGYDVDILLKEWGCEWLEGSF